MTHQTTILGVLTALLVVGGGAVVLEYAQPQLQDTYEGRVLVSHELIHDGSDEPIVSYEYVGAPLPERIVEDEVVEKRTEHSYTRALGDDTYQAIIYEKPIYIQQDGEWYYREEATTTESAFYKGFTRGVFAYILPSRVEAASYSGFSASSDGWYDLPLAGDVDSGLPVDFNNCINAVDAFGFFTAPTFTAAGTTADIRAQYRSNTLGTCQISRGYLVFDTSSIPSGSTVSAATVAIYVTAKANNVNDAFDTITITRPNLFWTSWNVGTASDSFDITGISTGAYTTFTLNATGRGYLTLGGTTELGIQEGHDVTQVSPASNGTGNVVNFSTSEQTGTSQDPTLSVTYTAVSKAFWLFQDF